MVSSNELPDYHRVIIENCRPTVDGGRFVAKATQDIPFPVSADIFADSHDHLLAWVRWRQKDKWQDAPLTPVGNDHWEGWLALQQCGDHLLQFVGCIDKYGSLLSDIQAKVAVNDDVTAELEEAAQLALSQADLAATKPAQKRSLNALAKGLRTGTPKKRIALAERTGSVQLMRETIDLNRATTSGSFPLWVDRPLAGFSAWYEMFPRSEGSFATAADRLDDIAAMGFDIVYLPPIHPIGTTSRKGANNSLRAEPKDPGSPWAIGSPEGGHTAVHPELGTLKDFAAFMARAKSQGLEIALDFAAHCSPDHPWVKEHPQWFHRRPDGSIRFAENPPKKYQDVYHLNFESEDVEKLWCALRDVLLFWSRQGVHVFRVDNPHTKPLNFWEWCIAEVRSTYPETIFLAEAFTQPRVMGRLAKVGFTQSYTYFTWRNSKFELQEYLNELASAMSDYFRPNFWPNTPDILHEYLQKGGPPAFRVRAVLAAICAPSWGIYSGYELYENQPLRPGSEEYLHSEKYEYKRRGWSRANSLAPFLGKLNQIRKDNRQALALLPTLRVQSITNDQMLCVSRCSIDKSQIVLLIVNLDPFRPQEGVTDLDLGALGLDEGRPFVLHDLLGGRTYQWQGRANYVRLDPTLTPAHIFSIEQS